MTCDIVLIGVGGQGVLSIGDLLVRTAFAADVPITFAPTKGMAQRGGFVKAELRLGREGVGPRIAEGSADLVLAMERSESLRGAAYPRRGGTFLLYDQVWEPSGVLLGQVSYPTRNEVVASLRAAGLDLRLLDPSQRPAIDGRPAAANIYALGALLSCSPLREVLALSSVERVLGERWPERAASNTAALRAGADALRRLDRGERRSGDPG